MRLTSIRCIRVLILRMSKKKINPVEIPRLLAAVAEALNACEDAGLKPRMRHGAVMTLGGYVLPTDGPWVARSSTYTAFDVVLFEEDEDA
jgi:3-hydroxyisobutyrate dehydrogenase-like beta-hydroxyacid dehydrogenase